MSTQTIKDRRSRTRQEIIKLIEERNSVLSQFYTLARQADSTNTDDIDDDDLGNITELLEEFCQDLVDYMATGHFELYRRLEEGNERRNDIIKLAEQIMPRINVTTQIAVDFNDYYDKLDKFSEAQLNDLSSRLAKLGEELATRIDLEDQLINTLLASAEKPHLTPVSA